MLRHLLGKELKDCPYGYRSLLLFVLSTVLSVVAAYAGSREHHAALEDHRLAQAARRKHLAEETNLYALFNFGFSIVKPPPVLGILVSGVEPTPPASTTSACTRYLSPMAAQAVKARPRQCSACWTSLLQLRLG